MSPISPWAVLYQASGRPTDEAMPTPASVIASTISCEATEVAWSRKFAAQRQPVLQPEPGATRGRTASWAVCEPLTNVLWYAQHPPLVQLLVPVGSVIVVPVGKVTA